MALSCKVVLGVSVVGILVAVYIFGGHDLDGMIQLFREEWATFILGGQIIAAFILASTKHYVAGGILVLSAMIALFGRFIV